MEFIYAMWYKETMLHLASVMLGSKKPKEVAEFYENVLEKKPDMQEGTWYGWKAGGAFFSIGEHAEVMEAAKEPQRIIINFETEKVQEEFERIKALGAQVIKEPYELQGMWIATLADPDGNYFQLVTPWKDEK